jgi:hypothetical protein
MNEAAGDLTLQRASSSAPATISTAAVLAGVGRWAWLAQDADDPSIRSGFRKKQTAQTRGMMSASRYKSLSIPIASNKGNVRHVVSSAGSRNNKVGQSSPGVALFLRFVNHGGGRGWCGRRAGTLEMKASFWVAVSMSMPIGPNLMLQAQGEGQFRH